MNKEKLLDRVREVMSMNCQCRDIKCEKKLLIGIDSLVNEMSPMSSKLEEERADFKRKMEHEHIVAEMALKEVAELRNEVSIARERLGAGGYNILPEYDVFKKALETIAYGTPDMVASRILAKLALGKHV